MCFIYVVLETILSGIEFLVNVLKRTDLALESANGIGILVADKIRSYMAEPDSVFDIASDFMHLNVCVWVRCNAR